MTQGFEHCSDVNEYYYWPGNLTHIYRLCINIYIHANVQVVNWVYSILMMLLLLMMMVNESTPLIFNTP